MKKFYLLTFTVLTGLLSFGQELLVNGDFETWTSSTVPTSWTTAVNVTQETTIFHGGANAAKQAPTATSAISQKITGLTPGETITLSLWYKASGDGTDARIWSKWGNNGTLDSTTDAALLQGPNNAYFNNGTGDWTQYTLNLTVPATANEFNFEVRTYNGGTVYWDDLSFLKTSTSSCGLSLGAASTVCDASTNGVDTYTTTVPFTGGGTETYTITPSVGTVSGDNPSTAASGNIIISGVSEGTNISLTVTSTNCNLASNIVSPACLFYNPLPYYEPFNYTVGSNLGGQGGWMNLNTGDEVTVTGENLSYTELEAPVGNAVTFDGAGSDPKILFGPVTSGDVYASFIFKVTNQAAITDLTDGGYFAALSNTDTTLDLRFWVKPSPDAASSTYVVGFGVETSVPPVTSTTYNVGDNVFVVMKYSITDGSIALWLNPDAATLEVAAPTAIISGTDATIAPSISRFLLRQASVGETPTVVFDELRIGTDWVSVTPAVVAAVNNVAIDGFAMYPNPAQNALYITTKANLTKEVQIFDLLGKQVVNQNVSGNALSINLKAGVYVIKVTENGKTATQKLVVE